MPASSTRHNSNNPCRHCSGTLFGARITGFPSRATPDPLKLVPLTDFETLCKKGGTVEYK
jgi:hypothetical protein